MGLGNDDLTIFEFDHKNWSTVDPVHAQSLISRGFSCVKSSVSQLSIYDLLSTNDTCGLLRMDVEGYEYELLNSCSCLLHKDIDLFIEFHSNLLGKTKSITLLESLKSYSCKYSTIIFNEEFAPDNQFIEYSNDNRKLVLDLDVLILTLSTFEDNTFIKNYGFELFLSKSPFNL